MKKTILSLSCLLLSMSYIAFSATPSVTETKTKTATPSSKKKPFKKLAAENNKETTAHNLMDDDLTFFDIFDSIDKEFQRFDRMMKSMHRQTQEKNPLTWKTSHGAYSIQEISTDPKSYALVIALPGFTREDVKVTLNQTKQRNITQKSLEIYAQKATVQDNNNTKSAEKIIRSEQFISSSNVNGKKSSIVYKDGELKVTFDLPDDVSDQSYIMTFDNNELKISFAKKAPDATSKVLEFTSKDSSQNSQENTQEK